MNGKLVGQEMVVTLTESLTANNVPKFNVFINELFDESSAFNTFILDLASIDNIDSVGVTFIIGLFKKVKALQCVFKVKGANDDVQDLFKLMKLDHFFDMSH